MVSAQNQEPNFSHGGNVYAIARQQRSMLTGILDFSANINPLGLASSVRAAINRSVEHVIHYPDADASELKAAISNYYNVDSDSITVGNGAVELIYVLTHTLRPQRVLIPAPAFSEYERAARAAKAEVEYAFLSSQNDFAIDSQQLTPYLGEVDIVFIGNPNNPTGTLLTAGQLERLIAEADQAGVIVVVDESFMDFIADDRNFTCRPLLKQYSNLVILHSLTKFYAIPGLRLGFALSNPALAVRLHAAKDPWNANSLAQAAGVAALADRQYQMRSRELIGREKDAFYTKLSGLPGLKPYRPAVNYIMVDTEATSKTAREISEALAARQILVRDCGNYPGLSPYYMRVAVKLPEQNNVLLQALAQVVAGVSSI